MAKVYYKVVCERFGRLFSSAYPVLDFPLEFNVEYKVGEFIKPTQAGTRLFVFPDLISARQFIAYHGWSNMLSVYECEVKNPSRKVIPLFSICLIRKGWESLFNQRKSKKKLHFGTYVSHFIPQNTVTASEIKLLRKV